MSEGLRWGEDLERDCAELKRLENIGLYPAGHHDIMCPICTDAPPVAPETTIFAEVPLQDNTIDLPPREEITD